jgi:hypothetical protein
LERKHARRSHRQDKVEDGSGARSHLHPRRHMHHDCDDIRPLYWSAAGRVAHNAPSYVRTTIGHRRFTARRSYECRPRYSMAWLASHGLGSRWRASRLLRVLSLDKCASRRLCCGEVADSHTPKANSLNISVMPELAYCRSCMGASSAPVTIRVVKVRVQKRTPTTVLSWEEPNPRSHYHVGIQTLGHR